MLTLPFSVEAVERERFLSDKERGFQDVVFH